MLIAVSGVGITLTTFQLDGLLRAVVHTCEAIFAIPFSLYASGGQPIVATRADFGADGTIDTVAIYFEKAFAVYGKQSGQMLQDFLAALTFFRGSSGM